jgi:hypothetical protein
MSLIKSLRSGYKKHKLLFVIVPFSLVGLILLAVSQAAVSTASIEPESGTKTGNAVFVANDTTASSNSYIKFGTGTAVVNENEFTFAAIPDTQQEVIGGTNQSQYLIPNTGIYMNQYFNQRMQWLADNKARLNLKYVWQVGDLQNWDTPTHDQYERASNGLKILDNAGIPYALANGNHDNLATGEGGSARDPAKTKEYLRNVDTWNRYYPVSRFPGIKTLCGEFAQFNTRLMAAYPAGMPSTDLNHPQTVKNECTKSDSTVNAYRTFTAGGLKWVVLNYEMWPRQVVQEWVKTVLERYADHNAVLATHYHIDYGGGLSTGTQYGSPQGSPRTVFDNVIKRYPNVKFVSSGHVSQNAYCSVETGINGNIIHHYLNDRLPGQAEPNYIRLVKFNVSARTITSEHVMPNPNEASRVPGNPSACNETNVNWVR